MKPTQIWALHCGCSNRFLFNSDAWHRSLDALGKFTVTSLMVHLISCNGEERRPLFEVIWEGPYPKKTEILVWELDHGGINTGDGIQRRLPYQSLSPL